MREGSVADDIRQSISEIVTLVLAFDEDFSVILAASNPRPRPTLTWRLPVVRARPGSTGVELFPIPLIVMLQRYITAVPSSTAANPMRSHLRQPHRAAPAARCGIDGS